MRVPPIGPPARTGRCLVALVAMTLALAAGRLTVGAAGASAATTYPVTSNLAAGALASLADPSASPAGVNVAGCQLTSAHPRPVVLVDGTFANMIDDWSGLGPRLANLGYCVYSTPLGADPSSVIQTYRSAPASAQQLAAFVDSVLARTGATQVDLVGHSQGGMLAEYYAKVLGGAAKVHSLVGISPTSHGTTLDGITSLAAFFPDANAFVGAICQACADQEVGSPVIDTLDNGPIAQPGVSYTIIETDNEFVVTPAGSSFIHEPGVTNTWLQSVCPFNVTDHADLTYDKGVFGFVRNALDPAHASSISCF